MLRRFVPSLRLAAIFCVLLPWSARNASAQRVEDSCHAFFDNPHQALDCAEAAFTQTDIPYYLPHLTVSSIPPANGFPIGVVYDKRGDYVSSPFSHANQSQSSSGGFTSLVDATAAAVVSTNGSWFATGAVTLLPPLYHSDTRSDGQTCNRLWALCTKERFGIRFYVTHRSLQTLYFYGLGPSSPNMQLSYRESDTFGGAIARMPVFDWLAIQGQIENRSPNINFSSGSLSTGAISELTAPGYSTQPDFMHYSTGIMASAQVISEPVTDNSAGTTSRAPLMKHKLIWNFENAVVEHWFADQNSGRYSFRQTVIDGQEMVKLHSVILRGVGPDSMTRKLKILKHFCNTRKSGLKKDDECDFGEFLFRPYLVLSQSTSGVVPFYFQPTLGGSDIDSRTTLRGFDDYRFRAPDAAMISIDYRIPVYDPIGAVIFYDAGNVGNSISDLSFAGARQDAGVGATLLLQRTVVAEMYVAWGVGRGSRFGYNFTKFF